MLNRRNFDDNIFNIIIGSSNLHHFDSYEDFLKDCFRILKPGGMAIFGEPFSIGYSLGSPSLLLAQRLIGTQYNAIDDFYNDLVYRNNNPKDLLKDLVDKHLFFRSLLIPAIKKIGFSSVDFICPGTRENIRDQFINELLQERGINDTVLSQKANDIYRVFYDLFANDNYAHSLAAFIHIVIKK